MIIAVWSIYIPTVYCVTYLLRFVLQISWLERKNLFQTFDELDEVEIEHEIKEIRALLDEDDSN